MSSRYASLMRRLVLLSTLGLSLVGCIHVKLDPIQIDANVNVKVSLDKALNDFFGDLDQKSTTIAKPTN
jgi:hypothetical protein